MEPNRRSKYSDEGIIMDTQKKKLSSYKRMEKNGISCLHPGREVPGVSYKVVRRSRRRRLANDVALQILGRS